MTSLEQVRQKVMAANSIYDLKWALVVMLDLLEQVLEHVESGMSPGESDEEELPAPFLCTLDVPASPSPPMPARGKGGRFLPKEKSP